MRASEPTTPEASANKEQEDPNAVLAAQKEAKKPLAISTVAEKCHVSDFDVMKAIKAGLAQGDELCAEDAPGGLSSFCYKIYLKGDPSVAVFTKLSFAYALWNPDKSAVYELERCDNEFKIMKLFSDMMGGPGKAPVVEPYHVVDTEGGTSKVMIVKWCNGSDVQLASQISNGIFDKRVILGFADAIATLNLAPVDDDWNEACRSCFLALDPAFKHMTTQFASQPDDQSDDSAMLVKELGLERCIHIIETMSNEYRNCREVLNHNDTKQWNIIVEPLNEDGSFGPTGKFSLCDWEMSIKGKLGKDIGIFAALPVACAICYATQGRKKEAYHLLEVFPMVWDSYVNAIKTKHSGKDEEFFRSAFYGMLGGFYLYLYWAYYAFGLHSESMPLQDLNESYVTKARGSMGYVGLKAGNMTYGGGRDISLPELRESFENLLKGKVDELLASAPPV